MFFGVPLWIGFFIPRGMKMRVRGYPPKKSLHLNLIRMPGMQPQAAKPEGNRRGGNVPLE